MEGVQKSATSNAVHHHQSPAEHYTVNFAVNSNSARRIRHSLSIGVRFTGAEFASLLCCRTCLWSTFLWDSPYTLNFWIRM